jgi:hypothetical protein
VLVGDGLLMLVTGEPVAEIDAGLAVAAARRERALACGDEYGAGLLAAWIDRRLDERVSFRPDPVAGQAAGVSR